MRVFVFCAVVYVVFTYGTPFTHCIPLLILGTQKLHFFKRLCSCVSGYFQIWVVGNSPSAPLLKAVEEVLPVIFTLFCFTKQNVSHLR